MSFRVNTNVAAMNAMRNLGSTNIEFSKSITRLSTGLRINGAADDPAGLIISEKFRAQIAGIDQAMRNSQDAINYAKTAEGAFDEVNRLLKDARTIALAAANGGTLTSTQIQANQAQIRSIADSVTRIASTTQFGSKKLLDGSSGVTSAVTLGSNVSSLSIGGQFGGTALSANGTVSINAITAATRATVTSASFSSLATAVTNTGSFTINGTTFAASAQTTAGDLVNSINQASQQTGVTASFNGGAIELQSNDFGANGRIDLVDSTGVIRAGGAGSTNAVGTNATATVAIGSTTALFTGGQNGNGGLTLSDVDGNTFTLTTAGNVTTSTASAVGQVVVGSATFQIGSNSGQTANLALGNYAASQLGTGVSSGVTLANVDLTSVTGATTAIDVIDKAIDEISRVRGSIGNFQRNVLESNIRSLGVAKENLSATESSIRDTDVAEEMTRYTKLQILQQAGMSVLGQANQAPNAVLNLLRG